MVMLLLLSYAIEMDEKRELELWVCCPIDGYLNERQVVGRQVARITSTPKLSYANSRGR